MANNAHYYSVGFYWWGSTPQNQLPRFLENSIWENGFEDQYLEKVKKIPVGSLLAAKTTYTRKHNGNTVSVLEIHNIGKVTHNFNDGRRLSVEWEKDFKPFTLEGRGAYRSTINRIWNQENIDLIFKKREEGKLEVDENDFYDPKELNTILFGPPGTGKTYSTIGKAVSIVDGILESALKKYYTNRVDLKERFNELTALGQIAMVTFHQSMSYEDFVEGIKPETIKDRGNTKVTYSIKDGVLKQLANKAKFNLDKSNNKDLLDPNEKTFDKAFDMLRKDLEFSEREEIEIPMKSEGYSFYITSISPRTIHFRKSSGKSNHSLSIKTLKGIFLNEKEVTGGLQFYYQPLVEFLKSYPSDNQETVLEDKENYVLIIDEINRGNISSIFGELITLVEIDKREGKEEALEIILPYSKEPFSLPSNLFIIGTMNTADRSVEALDTALRRRFTFESTKPNPSLVPELKEFGIDLRAIFIAINNRITYLLDGDHQIGHSYFMSISNEAELKSVFKNKIIPLLKEYFFNDYGKIRLVLGDGFVKKLSKPKFAVSDDELDDDLYEIVPIDDNFSINEALLKTL